MALVRCVELHRAVVLGAERGRSCIGSHKRLAILTTDVAGCRETVIEGKNGFLVPLKDVNALAEAMEKFIVDPDLIVRMGETSREIVVKRFDVHKVNARIMEVMGLLKEKPSQSQAI